MPSKLESLLDQYVPEPQEQSSYAEILHMVQEHPRPFDRDSLPGHVTGSAFLLSPDLKEVLLTHHKKFEIWLQLGGHSDGDDDTLAVAHREAWEESGISAEEIVLHQPGIFAVKIDHIPAYGDMPEHKHYDIAFLFRALHKKYIVSEESHDLRWVPLGEVALMNTDAFTIYMAEKAMRQQNKV